jgi:hypothetical protein
LSGAKLPQPLKVPKNYTACAKTGHLGL